MTYPKVAAGPGVTRQVLAENPELMVVEFCINLGAEGKIYNHPHVQSTYIKSGRFSFIIDGETHELGEGDSVVIPSNAKHGCVCHEAGSLIDTFTPRRDDFL